MLQGRAAVLDVGTGSALHMRLIMDGLQVRSEMTIADQSCVRHMLEHQQGLLVTGSLSAISS